MPSPKRDIDEGRPRKKLKRAAGQPVPNWEKTRQFAPERRRKVSLPIVQQDGRVQRLNVQRPMFFSKPQNNNANLKKPDSLSESQNDPIPPFKSSAHDITDERKAEISRRKDTRKELYLYAEKIESVEALKTRIAAIATKVVANPEENVALLKELRKMAQNLKGRTAALVILTESQLYKDICPAYRIREISEKEAETKVSKEIAKLRRYEQTLAKSYQNFVKSCVSLSRWKSGGAVETPATRDMHSVRLAVCKALAELIRSLAHFNEANVIANAVCALTCDREVQIRRYCADALKAVLGDAHRASGSTLETCLRIAKQLATAAVGSATRVPAEAVEPLAEIQFARFSLLPISKKAKNAPKKSKRFNRKRSRKSLNEEEIVEQTELEKDLKEADAEASADELYRAKKSLLESVCDTYFNIIKEASNIVEKGNQATKGRTESKARKPPPALSPALKGLLRVASFISADVIEAILGALTPLLELGRLPLSVRFRCLAAAYAVLGIHSRTQQANPDSFTGDTCALDVSLYSALGCLYGKETPAKDDEYITYDAIESLLSCLSFREMPLVRCSAIARRLTVTASALVPTHTCSIGLLRIAQMMLPPTTVSPVYLQKEQKTGRNKSGSELGYIQAYDLDTDDPEIAGAEKSIAWELSSLVSHFHPTVREIAAACTSGYCGARLPKSSDNILLVTKSHSSAKGGFNPPPMDMPLSKAGKKHKFWRTNICDDRVLASIFKTKEERLNFVNEDIEAPEGCFETYWMSETENSDTANKL